MSDILVNSMQQPGNVSNTNFLSAMTSNDMDISVFSSKQKSINTEKLGEITQKKAELQKENDTILQNALKKINENIEKNTALQAQLILDQLDKQAGDSMDIASALENPIPAGKNSRMSMGINGNILTITAVINDSIGACPEGLDATVHSRVSTSIEIKKETIQNVVIQYLKNHNFFDMVKNMKPNSYEVLEKTDNGIPLVTAKKDANGKTIIQIMKNGINTKVEFNSGQMNEETEKLKPDA